VQIPLHYRALGIALLAAMASSGTARAQQPTSTPPAQGEAAESTTPCVKQPPLVRLGDYDGPLGKTVGIFAQPLELKTVHPPDRQPGLTLCTIKLTDKFVLFVRDASSPATFLEAGFLAGLDQAENRDPSFGQGGQGFSKRFAADFADQASFKFFKDLAYPAIFKEDPRYYRLIHGSSRQRLMHAVGHAFLAHRDNGEVMFNFSEWMGTTSAVVLSNVYHPGNERGVGPAAEQVSFNVLEDMGFDMLREFWPEISHKLKLPFRDDPGRLGNQAPRS
jgi:hypothetical protein